MTVGGIDELMKNVEDKQEAYNAENDVDLHKHEKADMKDAVRHTIFEKGLSKRIWEELYKVIISERVSTFSHLLI